MTRSRPSLRGSSAGPRRSRWLASLLVLAVVAVLGWSGGTAVEAGRGAAATAATTGVELAWIEAAMPRGAVGWRVVSALARPAAVAPMAERSLGFVLADRDPLIVTDAGEEPLWLEPGSAWVVGQGQWQRRQSTGAFPVPYIGIELVVEPDLRADYSLGSAALRFAGPVFAPPLGRTEVVLTRYDLADGERLVWEGHPWPVLALATAGELLIGPVGSGARSLFPGEAGSFADPFSLTAVDGAASLVTASLRVPAPSGAGEPVDLGVWTWACPPGVVAQPDMRDLGCVLVDPLAVGLELRLSGPGGGQSLAGSSVAGDAGARLWPGVPLGSYGLTAVLPGGFKGYATRSYDPSFPVRLRPDGTGYGFEIGDDLFGPGSYRRVNLDVYLLR